MTFPLKYVILKGNMSEVKLLEYTLCPTEKLTFEDREQVIATMWGTGYSVTQIAKELKLTPQTVIKRIRSKGVQQEVKRIRDELDEHFQLLRFKLVSVIRDALESSDPQIALAGAAVYVKTAERLYGVKQEELSTEDVVRKLLEHPEIEEERKK